MNAYVRIDAYGKVFQQFITSDAVEFTEDLLAIAEPLPSLNFIEVDGSFVALAPAPTPYHAWQGRWVDARPYEELLALALARIASWYAAVSAAPLLFNYAGREWDGGAPTAERLATLQGLTSLPDGHFWADAANSPVVLTLEELQELAEANRNAMAASTFAAYNRQRSLKLEVATLATEALSEFCRVPIV